MINKSMLSMIAATAILGLTGCGNSGDTSTVTATETNTITDNNSNRISDAKGTVTGTVMDTNGNPIAGVSVSVLGQTTTTDNAGIYVFNDVAVTNTVNPGANVQGNALQVTISAPDGYLGATVTVTPQAQQISSDADNGGANTGTTNPNTNFIDGYVAVAGTAVLPKLGAEVTGRLELASSEQAIANQEISLDFVNIGGNTAQPQNGVTTTYATPNYTTITDGNGIFTFKNLPADSALTYVVPNYTVVGEQVQQGATATNIETNSETSVINIGDLQVNPVVQQDSISPYITGVTGAIGNTNPPQMLEDDVRQTFVINFSEPMDIENDTDFTNSVIVKAGATRATMSDVNATATINNNGQSITVTLDNPLTDATLLDINLLVSDFKDKAGNFLAVSTVGQPSDILYDSAAINTGNGQVVVVQLQIFNDLNTNAPQITTIDQQKLDNNGINDAALLQQASTAFNDVIDSNIPDNIISQLNSSDDDNGDGVIDASNRLANLGNAALGVLNVQVEANVARVTFEPTKAAAYIISLSRNGTAQSIQGNVLLQGGATVGTIANSTANATDVIFTPANTNDTTPVELALSALANVRPNDLLTITPVDELGYTGTSQAITLVDNVEPTTVLQNAYGLGNDTNASNTVVQFGAGGELADNTGSITAGTPILNITAALLDNLDAAGQVATGVITPDNTLGQELFALSTAFDHDNNANTANQTLFASGFNVYDTVAYAAMNRTRTIGVAFSEDIDLNGTTPSTSNISDTLSGWKANNDVVRDADGTAVNYDLVNFVSANVETLANTDAGGVIDFTGIVDNAGNVATANANAKVVLADKLPPLVTKASFTGSNVVIDFNEPITLTNGANVVIEDSAGAQRTATYLTGNTNYVLSNNNQTLTINVAEFVGLSTADFDLGSYVETAYDSVAHQHAQLSWTFPDANGNDWLNTAAGVIPPKFAVVDLVGPFAANTPTFSKTTSTTTATIVWTFTHPIDLTVAGTSGPVLATAVANPTVANINALFNFVGVAPSTVAAAGGVNPTISLSADNRTITLVLGTDADFLTNQNLVFNLPFRSAVDSTASINVIATAN